MKVFFNSWRDTAHPLAGGSELVVDRLANELLALGHEVVVAVPRPAESHPYQVVTTGSFYSQFARSPFTAWRHARSADVIIDVANGIPHFTPLWLRHRSIICWVHHVCDDQWSDSFRAPVARVGRFLENEIVPRVYRNAAFVAVSESTRDALVRNGVSRDSIEVIHNGIDVPSDRRPLTKSETPLFVSVARLVPNKRIDLLIEMWRTLSSETEGRLVIIGDGPLHEELSRDLPPRCELVGRVPDDERDDWLRRAWLFVQTSAREGWGMSVIEAAMYETPALALDVPGSRDAIVDGETGILAPDRSAFLQSWGSLAGNDSRRTEMGRAARRRAEQFSWKTSARCLERMMFARRQEREVEDVAR